MRKIFLFFGKIILVISLYNPLLFGAEPEIPCSFDPVGSGARAMGMGGAFIAVADDATAASWNSGGLIHLKFPEISLVLSGIDRREDISFGTDPDAGGSHSISEENINYLSATYPFSLFRRNMVVSLSYQHLYDFNRDWSFSLNRPELSSQDNWEYQQSGKLSALGLSYCIQVIPKLAAGFTLNLWDDDLADNHWEQDYSLKRTGNPGYDLFQKETYSFKGINANIGILWRINYKLTLGAVLKTPFKADIEHNLQQNGVYHLENQDDITESPLNKVWNEALEMPMSYGIGISYKFTDKFILSGDIYRTEWDDFVLRDEKGNEKSPVTGLPMNQSDISPTHQVRIGAEYLVMSDKGKYIFPIRAGIFYDPAPAEKNPDDFYGFSIGAGINKAKAFSLDIAYQYRFGNDAGESMLKSQHFSQDVHEHKVYVSLILYFPDL